MLYGLPTGTRTPIDRLGGDCSILLSYKETSVIILVFASMKRADEKLMTSVACLSCDLTN